MDKTIKESLEKLLVQFECDFNLLYGDIRETLRQKNIIEDKVMFYGASSEEIGKELLKLMELIAMAKHQLSERSDRWLNLESISSAMLKLVSKNE